jgi:hypothetical protein
MTGFSCPIFGISWQPPTPDVTVARAIVAYLEDRRVLFAPFEVELPNHCLESVQSIRQYLTNVLVRNATGPDLTDSIRAMRGICRKFMSTIYDRSSSPIGRPIAEINTVTGERKPIPWNPIPDMRDIEFNQALGELRGVFGIQVGMLATKYGLDIEDDLASILPLVE